MPSESSDALAAGWGFDPPRLSMARRLAGLDVDGLAEVVGHPVEDYELGRDRPTADVLRTWARTLGVAPDFFVAGRPRLHLDLTRTSLTRRANRADSARAGAFLELLWEVLCAVDDHVELPPSNLACRAPTPAALARGVRLDWRAPRGPLPHLTAHLEARGIMVVPFPGPAFSALLPGRAVIALDPRLPGPERRWAAAVEFGGLLLGVGTSPDAGAAAFAAELLLPAAELTPRTDLTGLATRYGVPLPRLLDRCRALGLPRRPADPAEDLGDETPRLLADAVALAFDDPVRALAERLRTGPKLLRGLLTGTPEQHLTVVR
ncbi:helix-turn-helix transcriptional regulator [Actinokineospora sp. NBRC 105648]|uniref:helix-turn-helix domain-containing protein n=1 Tax=Actinokineospora sp. NBRC 105648 TaxID=3032206 RepID=UPI0024A3F39E|nr:helix-turn-helix transcriptional regulator [Actinokineospora sp. NBRC 105648]GLZ36378.1 hypothetical protein Acsp05_00030 [Actinokineospora sp. NBRC 105648]